MRRGKAWQFWVRLGLVLCCMDWLGEARRFSVGQGPVRQGSVR